MKSYSFTTDAIGNDEPIVTQTACRRVVIYENDQAATADYKLRFPTSSDVQITRPAGSKTELTVDISRPFWFAGETIAYIAAASGTLTMVQEEW